MVIGVTIVAVLLVAGFALWMKVASNAVEDAIDYSAKASCYSSGFGDGADGSRRMPPSDDSRCRDSYADGYGDGRAGSYDPPSRSGYIDSQSCYTAGYELAMSGAHQGSGPADNPECTGAFDRGFENGRLFYGNSGDFEGLFD